MSPAEFAMPERPRLRSGLAAAPDESDPGALYLWDPLRVAGPPVRVSRLDMVWLRLMTGERTLRDLQLDAMRMTGGLLVPLDAITALVARMDAARFLDSPRLHAFLGGPEREPACVGCYPEDPAAVRRLFDGLFTRPDGPGRPGEPRPDGKLRAALVPHIDYARGNVTYAWGFKEVFERSDASLFVIVGTAHYSRHRFTLTRKHFRTPLGLVETDGAFIDRLVAHYGDGLFDDPFAHLPEHSIELEVVLLQYYYARRRPIRIVPLLVGSFHDCIADGSDPADRDDVGRMIAALRAAEAETPEPVCYLISGDLAHIGPKFDDSDPVSEPFLAHSHDQDRKLIAQAEAADPLGVYRVVEQENDARRICGLPPAYTVLSALRPSRGRLAHYGRYVHPQGHESVSFASVVFER
jgi:AmmeMemoRadiSam system protein B